MFADHQIENLCDLGIITNHIKENIQPVSLDVRLSKYFSRIKHECEKNAIDPFDKELGNKFEAIEVEEGKQYCLQPGDCVLGSTIEYVNIPDDVLCEVHGKSSLGRLFLIVHATAGLVDPGFKGHITLEIVNHSRCPILLTPGMPVAQLTFSLLNSKCSSPYKGKYQDQGHAVPSLFHLNKKPA